MTAVYEHGTFPVNTRPIDEANLLVESVKVKAQREKKTWKGAANKATQRARYTDPMLIWSVVAYVSAFAGFATQHPGTAVTTFANFDAAYRGFDPADGVMVLEDPEDEGTIEDMYKTSFTVVHMPFVE